MRRFDPAMRAAAGAIFLVAGAVKLGDAAGFAEQIARYRLLGDVLARATAHGLPWLEILAGACLLAGLLTRGAAWLGTAMSLVFAAAIVLALLRDLNVACGCFGAASGPVGWLHAAGNLVLASVCTMIARARTGAWRLENALASRGNGASDRIQR